MPACANVWSFLESKKTQEGILVMGYLLCKPGLEPFYRNSEFCWGLWHTPTHGRMPGYKQASGGFTGQYFMIYFSFYGYLNTQT